MSGRDKRFLLANRLTKSSDFQEVFAANKRFTDSNFLVLIKPNESGAVRLGLAVSKKQIPLAVSRNKMKRLIRESFRHHKLKLQGYDIVVVTKKTINYRNNRDIERSLRTHWDKIIKCEKL